jgi:hypothetical protein
MLDIAGNNIELSIRSMNHLRLDGWRAIEMKWNLCTTRPFSCGPFQVHCALRPQAVDELLITLSST